jgi:hypothetical protein
MEAHYMTAPLVVRLLSRLNEALDEATRGAIMAELACYYARIGDFEEADEVRRELRLKFADARSARVSILIMVLESILLYFRELSPHARDRMLRANLLSKAFREEQLSALTSAWLAHIDFNQGRFDSMAAAIRATHESIAADDGTAACRVALVLGDAFLFCNNRTSSRRWYEEARRNAVALGDQAAVGAITYNSAALHVAGLRIAALSAPNDPSEVSRARSELQSAINYQSIARLTSLNHLLKSTSIGVAMLESRHVDALELLNEQFLTIEVPAGSEELALHQADLALCLAKVERAEESRARRRELDRATLDNLGADERALIYDSLALAAVTTADPEDAANYRSMCRNALSEHLSIIGAIQGLISGYTEPRRASA